MITFARAILKRKLILVVVVVAALVVWGIMAKLSPPEVVVEEAFRGPLDARIAASGIIETRSSDLGFESGGRVSTIYVTEGDAVGEGETLAWADRINPDPRGKAAAEVMRAPYAGTIVEVYRRIGAMVGPGEPVIRIVSSEAPWITAFVESEDAVNMRVGQTLSCRAGGYLSMRWDVTVSAIGKEAVPRRGLAASSRQVRVRCDVTTPGFTLPPGTEVDIDGDVPLVDDATLIPTAAVVNEGAHDWVWVVDGDRTRRREIRVGRNNFDHIAVLSGLEPGETVVVHGKTDLREDQRVEPVPAPPMRSVAPHDTAA